ncbi:Mad3/BUB1-like region 1 protein (macronuclear) [Tetrahymena thermophila SB210]|uniref:Mad3/BUB1-like region 1 protein n=1 Tax=Tetrahymena thermophila (strain SB210) TaxID=312017 RepID=Q233C8_TETTS|nr:Mad3/BUB1-like region 1 protein [Tetrahymena thermophila SB210]EAR91652.2 Mad3/BUB1-like region 1 protein [Tetrahymena thermophila SB210]|eukprot:XP_001011897.2 Mad3/BUB1-like region 1 protein [Tetrahymena thermophila SB210]
MMNLGSYFQSELKEVYEQEGLVDNHYSLLFQSQNASQKFTKKQISDKLSEYKTLISQIDAQEDPMATWEEYLDFLMNYQDRTISEINYQIFQELEKFTKYSCERDYIKRDHRCVRFWIEYSDMCKDKEDVIYHMEENEIGVNSAFFYEEICKITEMKMDYQQADRYILEGKYSQAQPEAKMNEVVTQFEQRMEQRINRLKQLMSMQIMYDNQLSDSKKRKRFEFDLRSDNFQEQQQPIIRKNLGKNNNMIKEEYDHKGVKFGNKRFSNGSYFGVSKMKQKKKQLPDKVYIGDGINIFVDEEYRQEVFPNSTILVTEYQNLVEEINEYLVNNHQDFIVQSQSQRQQQQINQMQFFSQQLMNSTQLSQKNKHELINSLQTDMFYCKKSAFEIDLQTSWIGREEKKYKSFEVMESQKNSQQIVQFNICDFIFENTSPSEQSPQLGLILKNQNLNGQKQNKTNLNNKGRELYQDNSNTPQRSPQKKKSGIIECESVFGSQSPYKFSSKQYGFYQSTQNNQKNKRQQIRNVNSQYDPSPLQNSSKRISLNYSNYQINEESQNNQKADECSQNLQFSSYNFNQNQQVSIEKSPLKLANEDFKQRVSKLSNRKSIDFNCNNQNTEQTKQKSPQSSEKFSNKEESLNKFYIDSIKKLNFCSENSKQVEDKQNIFDFSKNCSNNFPNKQQNSYYHTEQEYDSDQSFQNSCLNKAFHNDINKIKSDDDDDNDEGEDIDNDCDKSSSFDLCSDQYSFLKNNNLSKSSKLSECVRSRRSLKFENVDIFNKNDLFISPNKEKLRMSSKRASAKKSVEKLRNTHQTIATILNKQNLNNQSFQSIQFSQEFSQVNHPQHPQDTFFSPNSLDDNIFKIIPPPKRKSIMNNKAKKTKKINICEDDDNDYEYAQNISLSDEINSKKSLTEQEDEEINDMLDQYCFSNENKFINQNIQNSLSNFTDSLQEKENQNLIINQRKSKSQNSMPRKALQQLPIEEFTEEAVFIDNPILPLFLSNNNLHDDAFYASSISNQENENQLFYSHNQFRNSRNGRSHQNQNSNHEQHKSNFDEINFHLNEESQFNQNLEEILSKSICQNNHKNDFQNQHHSNLEVSNQSLNNLISKTKQHHRNDNIHINEGFKEDQLFNHIIEETCFKNEKKLKTIKRMN